MTTICIPYEATRSNVGGDAIWEYEMLILRQCSWYATLEPDRLGGPGWPLAVGLEALFFGFWINKPCLGYWAGAIPEIRLRSFCRLGPNMNCTLGLRLPAGARHWKAPRLWQ